MLGRKLLCEDNVDLIPWYCFNDAQLSALDVQAEKVHRGKVQGSKEGEEWKTADVDDSSDRSVLELAAAQHPRALPLLVQHPADRRSLHHLKLHTHRRLLGGETHVDRVHPEIAFFSW